RAALLQVLLLLGIGQPRPRNDIDEASPIAVMGPKCDVLQDRHACVEAEILERACNAQSNDLVGTQTIYALAGKSNAARRQVVEASDTVEERGLAGTVGTDQATNLVAVNRAAYPSKCTHAAKLDVRILHFDERRDSPGDRRLRPGVACRQSCEAILAAAQHPTVPRQCTAPSLPTPSQHPSLDTPGASPNRRKRRFFYPEPVPRYGAVTDRGRGAYTSCSSCLPPITVVNHSDR